MTTTQDGGGARSAPSILTVEEEDGGFGLFYERYMGAVTRFLTRRLGERDVVADLSAETFFVAFQSRAAFRGSTEAEERAWVFSIARTQLLRHLRRQRAERAALGKLDATASDSSVSVEDRVADSATAAAEAAALGPAMRRLPAGQRRAIELRVVEGQDYTAVAAALRVSEEVARARVSRGLRALLQAIEDHRSPGGARR